MPHKKKSGKPLEMVSEQENLDRLTALTDRLVERVNLLENIVIKYERKCLYLEDRIIDLTARSMRDNVIISNVPEQENENSANVVTQFVNEKLNIDCSEDIIRAHRIGTRNPENKSPRPLVAKLKSLKKEEIMSNSNKLRGKRGAGNKPLFISTQEPEAYVQKQKGEFSLRET